MNGTSDGAAIPDAGAIAPLPDLPPVDTTPTEFVVLRVGDGAAALSTTATAAVFLERRQLADGTLVGMAMPVATAANATNQPLSLTGAEISEGAITRSASGDYLLFAGYAVAPGSQNYLDTAKRVVGRMDTTGAVDTSTTFTPANPGGNYIRGVMSSDGNALWAAEVNGIDYLTFGSTAAPIELLTANTRALSIFDSQLYASRSSNTGGGVNSVGKGLPTTANTNETQLSGFGNMGNTLSPYGFVGFDTDNTAGMDKLYVADDRSGSNGGGVQRWSLNGNTWQLDGTMSTGLTSGARGLDGYSDGTSIVLIATTSETAGGQTRVVSFTDTGGMPSAITAKVLANAVTNTAFRGVAVVSSN
jgi:hypothetical protein